MNRFLTLRGREGTERTEKITVLMKKVESIKAKTLQLNKKIALSVSSLSLCVKIKKAVRGLVISL